MPETGINKRGIALFIVLGILLVVTVLASAVMNFMLSHTRLTRHQTGRIQAYYASWAGVNYAIEMLRINDPNWPAGTYTKNLCNTNPNCTITLPGGTVCHIPETNLPCSVSFVAITVGLPNSSINNTRQVSARATYTSPSP